MEKIPTKVKFVMGPAAETRPLIPIDALFSPNQKTAPGAIIGMPKNKENIVIIIPLLSNWKKAFAPNDCAVNLCINSWHTKEIPNTKKNRKKSLDSFPFWIT